jgi:hypothetical protein
MRDSCVQAADVIYRALSIACRDRTEDICMHKKDACALLFGCLPVPHVAHRVVPKHRAATEQGTYLFLPLSRKDHGTCK